MDFQKELKRSKELEESALEKCNTEPIEIPGLIQSYGALIAFDFDSLAITYVSDNIDEYLDLKVENVANLTARDVFDRQDYHDIANIASHKSTYNQREQVKEVVLKGEKVDLSLFRWANNIVLELSPVGNHSSAIQLNSHMKWTLDTIKPLRTIDEILNHSVQMLKRILQFDRVMAYKFHPDDSGEVIAEANSGKMDSYLSLRFPSYDIPKIARDLFLKTPVRFIHSTDDTGSKIIAANKNLEPLNLSLSILRGNSPIHNQYLKNMNVGSTLTLPIIVNGKLWGLFAHHNNEEKLITSEIIYAVDLIAQLVSMILSQRIIQNAEEQIKHLQLEGDGFITLSKNTKDLNLFWENYSDKIKKLLKCDGVAYQIDNSILTSGSCPPEEAIVDISEKLVDATEEINHFVDLDELEIKGLGISKGLLALRIKQSAPKLFLYFFRDEVEKKVMWAGNPKKDIVVEKEGVRLHPRSSFNHFSEINKGKCELWDSETVIMADIANKTFQRAERMASLELAANDRLKTIVQELNHRLRNILTLVRSISRQTIEEGISIDNYVDSLEQRILALAKANNLLTTSSYSSVDLKTLLIEVVLPLCNRSDTIKMVGPDIKLVSDIIPVMVLIIHELTTNAIKHGSLSNAKGGLKIQWQVDDKGLFLEWKEQNGPVVIQPKKIGFGLTIIKNVVEYEFSGKTDIKYESDGLYVKFIIPHKLLGANEGNTFVFQQVSDAQQSEQENSKDHNILILEDDFISAADLKKIIVNSSINEVNTFSNSADALRSLGKKKYSLALLDVNLKNETSIAVARACTHQKIPFYYVTGYGNSFLEEKAFPKAPVLLKPVRTKEIESIINKIL